VTVRTLVLLLPGLLACGPAATAPASAPAAASGKKPAPRTPPPPAPQGAMWPAAVPYPTAPAPAFATCFPPTAVAALAVAPREDPVERYRRAHKLWATSAALKRADDYRDLSLAALLARTVAFDLKEPKLDQVGGWAALIYYDALNRLAQHPGATEPCRVAMERDIGPIIAARCPRGGADGEACAPLRRVYCILSGADPRECP